MSCIHSSNGFISTVWGPVLWFLLHTFSYHSNLITYHKWFDTFQYVLPCGACRDNFLLNIKQSGYSQSTFRDRRMLTMFVYTFHNTINHCLNKKTKNPTFQTIDSFYKDEDILRLPILVHITAPVISVPSYLKNETNSKPQTTGHQRPYIMRLWWFLLIICALNYPLNSMDTERQKAYYNWLLLSIQVLPETFSHIKYVLVDCFKQSEIWIGSCTTCHDRDMFVKFVLHMLQLYCTYVGEQCESIEHIIKKYEYLRATDCTKSTLEKKGTCKKGRETYICQIVSMTNKMLPTLDHCFSLECNTD